MCQSTSQKTGQTEIQSPSANVSDVVSSLSQLILSILRVLEVLGLLSSQPSTSQNALKESEPKSLGEMIHKEK